MSSDKSASTTTVRKRQPSHYNMISAHGEPFVWLTGAALVLAILFITGLLLLIGWQGLSTFWPSQLSEATLYNGNKILGEKLYSQAVPADSSALTGDVPAELKQRIEEAKTKQIPLVSSYIRANNSAGNRSDLALLDQAIDKTEFPDWAVTIERYDNDQLNAIWLGLKTPTAEIQDQTQAWAKFQELLPAASRSYLESQSVEKHELGAINRRDQQTKVLAKQAEKLKASDPTAATEMLQRVAQQTQQAETDRAAVIKRIDQLREEYAEYKILVRVLSGEDATGTLQELPLTTVIRIIRPNQQTTIQNLGTYLARWWEFISTNPRNTNTEGGVFPCIWGTVAMTLSMCLLVTPFGVLAALYLREYAQPGLLVSMIRIAINNLAGVPALCSVRLD